MTRRLFLLLALMAVAACAPVAEEDYAPTFGPLGSSAAEEYRFGVHPLHNPARLFEVYGPLMDYLNARIPGARFRLEASRNYAEYDKKLYSGHFHFALPNPYQTVNSLKHGYTVFGKMGDDANFRGIILVRKDSPIRQVADLKGKAVSYPAPTALAATMMPQYFLQTQGLDVNRDIANLYVGSQESSIMNVYLGKSAAGATWPPPWIAFTREHPTIAAQLEVKWETASLPNNGLVVRNDVPAPLRRQVEEALFNLHATPEGKAILARIPLSRFEPATSATYEPVRTFLRQYAATVRPLEEN